MLGEQVCQTAKDVIADYIKVLKKEQKDMLTAEAKRAVTALQKTSLDKRFDAETATRKWICRRGTILFGVFVDDGLASRDAIVDQNDNSLIDNRWNLTRFSTFWVRWFSSEGVNVDKQHQLITMLISTFLSGILISLTYYINYYSFQTKNHSLYP